MAIKLTPSEEMKQTAKNLQGAKLSIKVEIADGGELVSIPASFIEIVEQLMGEIAKGNSLTIITSESEISSIEAADILDVSHQQLIELLESGELAIPFQRVGKYYRLSANDVLDYKEKIDQQRIIALEELALQAQELKLGYE